MQAALALALHETAPKPTPHPSADQSRTRSHDGPLLVSDLMLTRASYSALYTHVHK